MYPVNLIPVDENRAVLSGNTCMSNHDQSFNGHVVLKCLDYLEVLCMRYLHMYRDDSRCNWCFYWYSC